ncbi:hypothetical protein X975_00240, partial [Stegodyphus mimosarum]
MQFFNAMAFGGHEEDILVKNVYDKENDADSDQLTALDEEFQPCEQNIITCDDIRNNSDSLSSSASISDSDLTSTDSEDSLALSESESITDVTPLNSPYCDSPLPQSRHADHKTDDKSSENSSRVELTGARSNCCPPEVNILIKAIEKLEMETEKGSEQAGVHSSNIRKKAGEELKRNEQENQRLFKRVISQSRMRSMYGQTGYKNFTTGKLQDLVKSDSDISIPKKTHVSKSPKEGTKYARRQQKCLSHPSYTYTCEQHVNKTLLRDGISIKSAIKITHETPVETEVSSFVSNADINADEAKLCHEDLNLI